MDYSQFLYMHEELSLLAVILILFIADLFMCSDKRAEREFTTPVSPLCCSLAHSAQPVARLWCYSN